MKEIIGKDLGLWGSGESPIRQCQPPTFRRKQAMLNIHGPQQRPRLFVLGVDDAPIHVTEVAQHRDVQREVVQDRPPPEL
jgi:hypothetical protein